MCRFISSLLRRHVACTGPGPFSRGIVPRERVLQVLGALLSPFPRSATCASPSRFSVVTTPFGAAKARPKRCRSSTGDHTSTRTHTPVWWDSLLQTPFNIYFTFPTLIFSFPFLLALACPSRTDPPLRLTCIPAPPRVPAYP